MSVDQQMYAERTVAALAEIGVPASVLEIGENFTVIGGSAEQVYKAMCVSGVYEAVGGRPCFDCWRFMNGSWDERAKSMEERRSYRCAMGDCSSESVEATA